MSLKSTSAPGTAVFLSSSKAHFPSTTHSVLHLLNAPPTCLHFSSHLCMVHSLLGTKIPCRQPIKGQEITKNLKLWLYWLTHSHKNTALRIQDAIMLSVSLCHRTVVFIFLHIWNRECFQAPAYLDHVAVFITHRWISHVFHVE